MQLIPIQKKILIGFAKKIKILAVREVRPNCTRSFVEKYKGLKKFIKGNFFRHIFSFFYIAKNFNQKTKHAALILRSRRSFRHQDRHICLTSYLFVICVICHNLSYYDKLRIFRHIHAYSRKNLKVYFLYVCLYCSCTFLDP